jgi:surface protein
MQTLKKFYFGKSKSQPFISTWKTDNLSTGSSTATQVKLPLVSTGSYNFVVQWGDGTQNNITAWNQAAVTHTYSVAGTYQITIKGICKGWVFNNTGDRLKILSVQQWGNLSLGTSQGSYFHGCANLNLTSVSDTLNLTGTTNLNQAFRGCGALTTINKISSWNTVSVNVMSALFRECTNFNQPIGSWNVSNVTDFSFMFEAATNFNSGDINNWTLNTVSSISMISMFQNCGFNSPLNLWNTTRVTNMGNMFVFNSSFNQNIGGWNISNVTNFSLFMSGKTAATFSAANLDAIYNGWSSRPVKTPITITFGTAKYTAASSAGRAILTGAPNNWAITDGGI